MTINSRPAVSRSETVRTESGVALDGPATIAATRVARLGVLLGVLGVASSLFVIVRLLETWRVTTQTTSHRISIVGQALSYPVANLAAVVVVLLAAVGAGGDRVDMRRRGARADRRPPVPATDGRGADGPDR